jgi:hypothetical protein
VSEAKSEAVTLSGASDNDYTVEDETTQDRVER